MRTILFILFFLNLTTSLFSQNSGENSKNDTITNLSPVIVKIKQQNPERMPEIKDNMLFSGKKNEVLKLSSINANLTNNNAREVFSRIPGVTVWENEGSGIQINVGVRGLSPNRSWELNTRQNGYDISSDVFGYPEAYYNPPLEAVETIQFVRGGASLQFGPQFGGMLNYVLKREKEKKFSFETQNTIGSYNLTSSFNAIGGNLKKFSYYIFNHYRKGNGWRENNRFNVGTTHAFVEYRFTDKTKISAEYTNSDYKMQQPGGLTDLQFNENSRQSGRERNWFGTPWNVFAINFDTKISDNWDFSTKIFGLIGERNSVGITATPDVLDAISSTTNNYANRQVDRDYYKNFGLETRSIYKYNLGKIKNNLAFGIRLYQSKTNRVQQGKGTTGSDFDLSIENKFARDLNFATNNFALFAENQFKLTEKFSATLGIRFENISSIGSGRQGISGTNDIVLEEKTITRKKPLFGVGFEYKLANTNIYANISDAFRPVLFSDLTPPAVTDVIDPNLKDASGFNADLGYRGTYKRFLNFDFSLFYLSYNNRIGIIRNDPTKVTNLYRTNLGETINKGIEGFVNVNVTKMFRIDQLYGNLDIFASVSFIDSRYTDFKTTSITATAPNAIVEGNLSGNRVENAPRYIHNFGTSWSNSNLSITVQHKISGQIYTDANNTEKPSTNGVIGLLQGYRIFDCSAEYKFLTKYNIRSGINNFTNQNYATRRSSGYPGPGILPGEARTFYISVGAKF